MTDGFALGGSLRRVRRLAGLSQRDLAARAGVGRSLVSRLEGSRPGRPSLLTVDGLLRAAGYRLAVVPLGADEVVAPMSEQVQRDHAGRHYPAHLDVRRVRDCWQWWYAPWQTTLLPPPTHTFDRNPRVRDERRRVEGRTARDDDGRLELADGGVAARRVNDIIYAYLPAARRR